MGVLFPKIVKGPHFRGVIHTDQTTEIKCFVLMEGFEDPIECRSLLKHQWVHDDWKDEFYELYCTENGFVYYRRNNRQVPCFISRCGYVSGDVSCHGKKVCLNVHRAIAHSFVENPDPDNKIQVNHIDGNKQNNHYTNLEWVTNQENLDHAFQLGLKTKIFTMDQIRQMREDYNSHKCTQSQLAKIYNVHCSQITDIMRNNHYCDDKYIRTRFSTTVSKKFDKETISKIRELGKQGVTRRELARMYGTDNTTISTILLNKSYSDPNYEPLRSTMSNRLLPKEDILDIRKMKSDGKTLNEISKKYDLSMVAISKIVRRETYSHID